MDTMTLVLALSLLAAAPQTPPPAQSAPPVRCEFRVFDAGDEVTAGTKIVVYGSGQRSNPIAADARGRTPLVPGLYDVQVIRERGGQVTGIRWVEHLLIQHYPDEQGRHLEVINFKPQYGALELRTGETGDQVTAFASGDRTKPVATGRAGDGYVLVVVPAGRYDVRVQAKGSNAETWLPDIDVPADRTRLRTIRPSADTPK